MALERVHVLGAGAWGTALAQAAAAAGRRVTLCGRDAAAAAALNATRRHPALGAAELLPAIAAQAGHAGIEAADFVLLAVPAQTTRPVLSALEGGVLAGRPVVTCAKGLEEGSLLRQSALVEALAPGAVPMVLSGPSFAIDVAAGRPTAVTLAGDDAAATDAVASALAGPAFRPYAAGDRIGVELAGALKNVYALGSGAVEGAGLGLSARSALIARAYAELSRLVVAMGGQAGTLTGLSGLGDLVLSCTSAQSRNYALGLALGRGESLAALSGPGAKLAEGVFTAPVAAALARANGVDVPLVEAVNLLLLGRADIASIVATLMARPLKREETP